MWTSTRSRGNALTTSSSFLPNGGARLKASSILFGSVASNCSMHLIPAFTSFRTVAIPTPSSCLIWSGDSSQHRAQTLRSSIKEFRSMTESLRCIAMSTTQRTKRCKDAKTVLTSFSYCVLSWEVPPFGKLTSPNTDWMRRETLWAGRDSGTGIENLSWGDELISLYIAFSPVRNRISWNSSAWESRDSLDSISQSLWYARGILTISDNFAFEGKSRTRSAVVNLT